MFLLFSTFINNIGKWALYMHAEIEEINIF